MKSIKDIVNECFPLENWEMKEWNFKNKIDREGTDRDSFLQILTKAFEENKIMKLHGEWHRGIGKTTFLMKVAEEYKIPLLVNTKVHAANLLKEYNNNLEIYPLPYSELKEIKSKYILLDLRCNNDIIEKIKGEGLIPLGFIYPPKPHKYELI